MNNDLFNILIEDILEYYSEKVHDIFRISLDIAHNNITNIGTISHLVLFQDVVNMNICLPLDTVEELSPLSDFNLNMMKLTTLSVNSFQCTLDNYYAYFDHLD